MTSISLIGGVRLFISFVREVCDHRAVGRLAGRSGLLSQLLLDHRKEGIPESGQASEDVYRISRCAGASTAGEAWRPIKRQGKNGNAILWVIDPKTGC
tara:strand:+ start:530 stop:823 length:294 start_codon:yes stop_codon:yes gene_type:complete